VPTDHALDVLATGAEALAHAASLEAGLERLLRATTDATGAASAAIFVQHPDRTELALAASVGVDGVQLERLASDVARNDDHPIRRALTERAAAFDVAPVSPGGPALRSHVPLVLTRDDIDTPLGVLALAHAAPLDAQSRRLAAAVADLAAVAVERARLASMIAERSEWFERMAHMDPLTGLANARTFARVLELELARAARQGSEVSLALFDIDDFRTTNASAGNDAGDDVLREVAAVLAESVRLVDTVARYGGDEFILVAPGSAGLTVARRVLAGVARLPQVAGRQVTVSAGVARFPADATTADDLLAAAEHALAAARAEGAGALGEATPQTAG
jgi:diguanylate cyclase (GGDEF)-like protein